MASGGGQRGTNRLRAAAPLAIALLLVACSGAAHPETAGRDATPVAIAEPAAFATAFCGAVDEVRTNAYPAIQALSAALSDIDIDAIGTQADLASASMGRARLTLAGIHGWAPGESLVADMGEGLHQMERATNLVKTASAQLNLSAMREVNGMIADGYVSISRAGDEWTTLKAKYSLAC